MSSTTTTTTGDILEDRSFALPLNNVSTQFMFSPFQTLQNCLDKFKRVLPSDKYDTLVGLVKKLQTREITREEFDVRYFEIMLPYVTPPTLPAQFKDGSDIHVPPYKLTEAARKQFLQFFQIPREQKHELLKANPELIPILRQFVILQRQKHINVTSGDQVLKIEGEVELPVSYDRGEPPTKKRKLEGNSSDIIEEKDALIAQLQATIEQLQAENKRLQMLYVQTSEEALEKLKYEEICGMTDQLLQNLSVLNKVQKTKHIEEQNDKYGLSCILCYENRRNVIFRPCSHVLQCEKCPIPKECPMCKKKVELANKIFL